MTPERTQENKNKSITISLLVWALKVNYVQALSFPDASKFTPIYVCPKNQIYSREITSLNIHFKQN